MDTLSLIVLLSRCQTSGPNPPQNTAAWRKLGRSGEEEARSEIHPVQHTLLATRILRLIRVVGVGGNLVLVLILILVVVVVVLGVGACFPDLGALAETCTRGC
jgi:hypothetical protein